MKGPPQGRIFSLGIGNQPVIGKALFDVIAGGLEGHVDAPAQVVFQILAVPGAAGDHLDLPFMVQYAAVGFGDQGGGQFFHRAGGEGQTGGCRGQAGGVGDHGHLDPRLGSVEEGIEHLRVEAAFLSPFGSQSIVVPNGFRRRSVEFGHIERPLAGRDDLESRGPGPIDLLADQGRLVAIGKGIHDPGLAGFFSQ